MENLTEYDHIYDENNNIKRSHSNLSASTSASSFEYIITKFSREDNESFEEQVHQLIKENEHLKTFLPQVEQQNNELVTENAQLKLKHTTSQNVIKNMLNIDEENAESVRDLQEKLQEKSIENVKLLNQINKNSLKQSKDFLEKQLSMILTIAKNKVNETKEKVNSLFNEDIESVLNATDLTNVMPKSKCQKQGCNGRGSLRKNKQGEYLKTHSKLIDCPNAQQENRELQIINNNTTIGTLKSMVLKHLTSLEIFFNKYQSVTQFEEIAVFKEQMVQLSDDKFNELFNERANHTDLIDQQTIYNSMTLEQEMMVVEMKNKIETLRDENNNLKQNATHTEVNQQKIMDLNIEIKEINDKCDQQQQTINQLNRENDELKKNNDEIYKIQELTETTSIHETSVRQKRDEINKLRREMDDKCDQHQQTINQLNRDNDGLKKKINSNESLMQELTQAVSVHENSVRQKRDEINKLRQEMESKCDHQQQTINQLNRENDDLKKKKGSDEINKIQDLTETVSIHETSLRQKWEEINKLRHEMDDKCDQQQQTINQLIRDNDGLKNKINSNESLIQELTQAVSVYENSVRQKRDEINKLRREMDDKCDQHQQTINQLNRDNDGLKKKINSNESLMQELTQAVSVHENSVRQKRDEINKLRREMDDKCDQHQQTINQLNRDNDGLKKKINSNESLIQELTQAVSVHENSVRQKRDEINKLRQEMESKCDQQQQMINQLNESVAEKNEVIRSNKLASDKLIKHHQDEIEKLRKEKLDFLKSSQFKVNKCGLIEKNDEERMDWDERDHKGTDNSNNNWNFQNNKNSEKSEVSRESGFCFKDLYAKNQQEVYRAYTIGHTASISSVKSLCQVEGCYGVGNTRGGVMHYSFDSCPILKENSALYQKCEVCLAEGIIKYVKGRSGYARHLQHAH